MKKTGIIRFISLFICFSLLFEQSGFAQVAGTLNLSAYLSAATSAPAVDKFRPLHLRYLSYDAQNNNFKLLLDKGDAFIKNEGRGTKDEGRLRDDTKTLLKYFLIGVSLPNDAFWVNLRPDSPDNVIDNELAFTDIGKILLEADVQLKKDTASYTSPTTPEGRIYWNKLYKKAEELFGYENITIPTLTRPWIVPGEIIIRESPEGAYIYKATLKVMLEEDYLRKTKDEGRGTIDYSFKDPRMKALNEYSTQLIKELIIPKITREVNTSKKYASLRQVYYSLILAQWFKTRHASSLQGASTAGNPSLRGRAASEAIPNLINSHNLLGLASKELWSKNTYFDQYQKSFKNGEYNIQEPVQTPYGQTVRSYFSGGADLNLGPMPVQGSTIRNPRGGCIISIAAATDRIIELSRRVKKYIVAMRSRGNPDNVEVETEGVASMGGTDQPSLSAGQLFRSEFGKAANNVMKFLNLNASNINRIIEYKKIFKQDSYLRVVYEYTITFDSGVQKVFYTKMAVIGAEDRAKIEKEGLISAVVFDIGLGPKTQIIQIKGEPVLISMPAEGQPINVAEALDADTTRALGFALGRLRGAGIIHGDFVSGWFDGVFRPDHIYVARIDNEIRVNFIDFSEGKMNDFDFENNLEKNLISSFVRLSLPIVFEQAYELGLHSLPAAAARLQTMMQISLATQVQARQLIDELNNPNSRAEIAIELLRRILGYYEMYGGHSENQRGNACTLTVFYVITRYIVRRLDITEFRAARLIGGIDFQVPGNLNKSEPIKILGVEIGTLDMEEGSPLNPSGKAEKVIENVNLNEEVMEQLLLALQAKITSAMPSQGLSIPPAASAAQVRTPAAGGVVQKLRAFWRDEEGSVKLPGERAAEDAAKARQIQAPGAESSDADITREIQPVSLPLKNDSLHFVVADQTRPPQLDRSKTISVSWVDMHNLVPGTLIHYKIAKGHWDYTLRIESDNMVSIWLRDEHGRALGSIDKLQSMNIISGGLNFTDGILDVSQSVAMPYFKQTPWKDGERLLLSVSVGGVSFAATPQDIIIQVPAGEILPVGAARLSATSDNAGLFQASPAAA
ncbi:MAG: hypothetical protein NTY47_06405, partial [Candidatus Omnitrophica bacterium]|nr:hypothetical protein [Candidatus Omnitrophota bacterium]